MFSHRSPMLACLIASTLALASCTGSSVALSPPAADLTPAPEPLLPDEALTSAAALDAFDLAVLEWARSEHGKVVRLCQWFSTMKAKGLDCTP